MSSAENAALYTLFKTALLDTLFQSIFYGTLRIDGGMKED